MKKEGSSGSSGYAGFHDENTQSTFIPNMCEEVKKGFEDMVIENQKRNGAVCKDHFQMLSVIGKGAYGKVLLVKKKDSGQLYAIKVLKKSELQRRN